MDNSWGIVAVWMGLARFASLLSSRFNLSVALRSVVVHGYAADAIVRYAGSEGMSLVVIGPHGHGRITRFFPGSTSDRVSEQCPGTVMIVK